MHPTQHSLRSFLYVKTHVHFVRLCRNVCMSRCVICTVAVGHPRRLQDVTWQLHTATHTVKSTTDRSNPAALAYTGRRVATGRPNLILALLVLKLASHRRRRVLVPDHEGVAVVSVVTVAAGGVRPYDDDLVRVKPKIVHSCVGNQDVAELPGTTMITRDPPTMTTKPTKRYPRPAL